MPNKREKYYEITPFGRDICNALGIKKQKNKIKKKLQKKERFNMAEQVG